MHEKKVVTDIYFRIVTYIRVYRIKKTNVRQGLALNHQL